LFLGCSGDSVQRAWWQFCRGKALNARDEYNPEAETLLTASVRLDPTNVEAWNALGEAAFKRKDYKLAAVYFGEAFTFSEV
jgi:Flp pilus assembly protein TadD